MVVFIGPDLRQSSVSDNEDEAEAEEIQLFGGGGEGAKLFRRPGVRASLSRVVPFCRKCALRLVTLLRPDFSQHTCLP